MLHFLPVLRCAIVLALAAPLQDRAAGFAEEVGFPPQAEIDEWRGKGDEYRKVLDRLMERKVWADAFRTVEQKLTPFPEGVEVKLELSEWKEKQAAQGARRGKKGVVRLNVRLLAEHQKSLDDLKDQQKKLRRQGKYMVFRVPPLKQERVLHHELTHVLQGELDAPLWFKEGMATWIGDDPSYLYAFTYQKKEVRSIEEELDDVNDAYARGMLFFRWIEYKVTKHGMKRLAEKLFTDKKPWKEALEEVVGMKWGEIVEKETPWSQYHIRKYRG